MSHLHVRTVGVFILRSDGAALFQLRDPDPELSYSGKWVPPGGHCEGGESPEACAKREIAEETDYLCDRLYFLGYAEDPSRADSQPAAIFWTPYDNKQNVVCREGQSLQFISRTDAAQYSIPEEFLEYWDASIKSLTESTRRTQTMPAQTTRLGAIYDIHFPRDARSIEGVSVHPSGLGMEGQKRILESFDVNASRRRCLEFRRRILEMSQGVSALHIGGSFSCLEIVDAIFFGLMHRGDKVEHPDTFLLSKGHGALAVYVILEELGILSKDDLDKYCKPGGRLGTHPDYGVPGIEASTGSLGHGLSMALGMALADKVLSIDRVIYVVMSDGEMQEGSVWESMMLAPSFGLTNIIAFGDNNDRQSFAKTSETHPNFYPIKDKVKAFGWETVEVNGHDARAIFDAVRSRSGKAPFFVIARTIKGKGVSFMEDAPIWHYRSPSPEEYLKALKELEETGE